MNLTTSQKITVVISIVWIVIAILISSSLAGSNYYGGFHVTTFLWGCFAISSPIWLYWAGVWIWGVGYILSTFQRIWILRTRVWSILLKLWCFCIKVFESKTSALVVAIMLVIPMAYSSYQTRQHIPRETNFTVDEGAHTSSNYYPGSLYDEQPVITGTHEGLKLDKPTHPLTAQALADCIMQAANTYQLPPAVLIGIMDVEGGKIGEESKADINGNYLLGPMKIQSQLLPQLEQIWQVNEATARTWLRDDGCVNVHVSAWLLKQKMNETGTLYEGIAAYHSSDSALGKAYANKVIKAMDRKGLVKHDVPLKLNQSNAQPNQQTLCLKIVEARQPYSSFKPEVFSLSVSNSCKTFVSVITIGWLNNSAQSCTFDPQNYTGLKTFFQRIPSMDSTVLEGTFSTSAKRFCILEAH